MLRTTLVMTSRLIFFHKPLNFFGGHLTPVIIMIITLVKVAEVVAMQYVIIGTTRPLKRGVL